MEFRTNIRAELAELRTTLDARKHLENNMTTPKRRVAKSPLPIATAQARNTARARRAGGKLHTPTYRDIICNTESMRPHRDTNHRMNSSIGTINKVTTNDKQARAAKVADTKLTTTPADDSFIVVEHKKRKQRTNMSGTLRISGNIVVAELQCAIYISRTKKDVTEADIQEHIMERGEGSVSVWSN